MEFAPNYDHLNGYAAIPEKELAHWKLFNHPVDSSEPNVKKAIEMLEGCDSEMFDLRPYMIEQPLKCD